MAADGSVVILIEGDDSDLKGKLNSIGGIAAGAAKAASAAIAGISTALAGAAAAAVKVGSEYETSLAKVSTIADTSVKSIESLSDEILNLSNATGDGAAELNEALYSAISAGADTAHAVELVAVAAKAARGGFTDTETAVDGLTSALNAYAMETTEAESLANKFLITQNLGKTTFGELAASIGGVAPTANAAGVSIDELLASTAALTANGIGTSEAMTGIKAALSNIIKPAGEAQKLAESLGIDFSAAALQTQGWAGFLAELQEKTGGNTEQLAKLFGSVEALNTVLTLTSEQGTALLTESMEEMGSNTTALEDAYAAMSDTLEVTIQKIGTNLQNLGIQFYESIQGPAQEAASGVLESVQTLSAAFQEGGLSGAIQALGGLAAEALTSLASSAPGFIDTAVELIQSFLSGLRENLPEIAASALEIVGSLAAGIAETLPELAQTGIDLIAALADGLIEALPNLIKKAPEIVGNLVTAVIKNAPKLASAALEMVVKLAAGIANNFGKLLEKGREAVEKLISGIKEKFSNLLNIGKEIIGNVKDGIKQKIEDAKNWGRDLIDNFVGGIKEKFQAVKDAVSNIANTVKDFIGFSEPEKGPLSNFHTYAPDMMQLFAKGIDDNAGMLKSAFDKSLDFGTAPGSLVGIERAVAEQMANLTDRVRAAVEAETANISVGLTAKGGGGNPHDPAPASAGMVVNVYVGGVPESTEKARNMGRELGAETAREIRRRGGVPA